MADDQLRIVAILEEYKDNNSGLILGLHPANERRGYFVTTSLIGWVEAYNHPCNSLHHLSVKTTEKMQSFLFNYLSKFQHTNG